MKNKTVTTIFTLFTLATTSILALSQSNSPTGFSVFSLPQNIGTPPNSSDNESGVAVAPNGLSLYFSSNTSGTLGSIDLWVSQRPTVTSAWTAPQNLTVLNSASNENFPALSANGKTIFFSCSCPDSFGGTDIYMSTRPDANDDLGWTAPVNVGAVVNTSSSELGAAYFEDPIRGQGVLYFTSDQFGSGDIYQSTRNSDGSFNAPTEVVELNSPALDRGLNIRRDGLEIFLSSERDGGAGGRDIWVATRSSLSAPWNPPVNLVGINSPAGDQAPSLSQDGSILYFSSARDGSPDIYAANRVSVNRSSTADFDGDGRSDLSVFRPSDGTWYVMESGNNTFRATQFGANGDKVVAGDYDGDGRTDIAVFRPADGNWYVQRTSDGSISIKNWGIATDRLVPGDYDGDGKTDIAVYRNGTWYIVQSTGAFSYQQFGLGTDIPIAGVN